MKKGLMIDTEKFICDAQNNSGHSAYSLSKLHGYGGSYLYFIKSQKRRIGKEFFYEVCATYGLSPFDYLLEKQANNTAPAKNNKCPRNFSTMPNEEVRRIAKLGAQKSAEVRRKKKAMKEGDDIPIASDAKLDRVIELLEQIAKQTKLELFR